MVTAMALIYTLDYPIRGRVEVEYETKVSMRRAEADIIRAHAGLPPAEPLPPNPSTTPETGRLTPPALSGNEDGAPSPL